MSEELIQRDLIANPERIGDWYFYNIGSTSLKALKTAGIIAERDYGQFEGKKPDALIVQKPNVIAAIEYKTPKELRTQGQKQKAIDQEIEVAAALDAKLFIVTDGSKSYWLNPATGNEVKGADGQPLSLNFDKSSSECIELMRKAAFSVGEDSDCLVEDVVVDPLPLAERVWQDLWTVSGASPVNCLYTFVELFLFKYLSDLGILRGGNSFNSLMTMYADNAESYVLRHYVTMIRPEIKRLFPKNEKDGTTIINGSIFVDRDENPVEGYAATFKNILSRFEKFGALNNVDYDFKSKLFETFLKESKSKENWGQYFTPLCVVRSMVDMADIRPGMKICDPACGVGKFLLEPLLDNPQLVKASDGEVALDVTLVGFDKGFDKEEQKTIILAKANMLIYLSSEMQAHPSLTAQFASLLNETFLLQTHSILGTLAHPVVDEYDLILTNPPYVMNGSGNLKKEIAAHEELKNHYSINAMGVEGLFMEWIVRALKPGGKAFVVVPDGVMYRHNDKVLRDFIMEQCIVDAIVSLPLNTFFTTNKKTYILAITKKSADDRAAEKKQDGPVLVYLCSEIGETRDMYRFPIEQNDLETASNAFNVFMAAGRSMPYVDPRCKVIPFGEFEANDHWCADRWWSREEKIELGVEEENREISISDFADYVGELASVAEGFQRKIKNIEKKNDVDVAMRAVTLGDATLFRLISTSLGENKKSLHGINKTSEDGAPVYTAAPEPIAWVSPELYPNKLICASCNHPLLSFATNGDGSAGRNFVIHERPFYINADRLAIDPADGIDVQFLYSQLFDMKKKYGFGHASKANKLNVAGVEIAIPVDERGKPDLNAQRKFAQAFFECRECVDELRRMSGELKDADVAVSYDESRMVWRRLGDLFRFERGSSKYTKTYGNAHPGGYPVYSASHGNPLTFIDTYDYEGRYLSWATNGFAGNMLVLEGRFSINGDRAVLIPRAEAGSLDLDYLAFVLQPVFRSLAKGRRGDKGVNEFTKLHPSMVESVLVPVPVLESGAFDMSAQRECAHRKQQVEDMKAEIANMIDKLGTSVVNVIGRN